jgi:hypothetical protein
MRVSLRRVVYIFENGIFNIFLGRKMRDFSPANRDKDVTEVNESS